MARNPWYAPKPRERKPARGTPVAVHRVRVVEQCDETFGAETPGLPVQLQLEHCRCGAWRARVLRGTTLLHTDWSAPCSAPSRAAARDDASL